MYWGDNKCDITGEDKKLTTHHLFSVKEYPNFRRRIRLGVVMTTDLHALFHGYWMGGYQNPCTSRDYEEFKIAYTNDEVFTEFKK